MRGGVRGWSVHKNKILSEAGELLKSLNYKYLVMGATPLASVGGVRARTGGSPSEPA